MNDEVLILLVEDDPGDAELALRALARSGLPGQVHHVADGEEALAFLFDPAAAASPSSLRVVFLDLKLPGIGGLEVLGRIRSDPRTRGLPVVILSSSMLEADVATCYRSGASSYVVKPVEFHEHARTLQALASYWLRLNVPWNRPAS